MFSKLSLIIVATLVILFSANVQPAHATGIAWLTSASCEGVTVRGTSTQHWVYAFAIIGDPVAEYVYIGDSEFVPVAQDGTYTVPITFGMDAPTPVPSGTTMTVVITDYSVPNESGLSSTIDLISVSVLCPLAGDPSIPPNFQPLGSACFVPVQSEPNGKQLSSYLIDYGQTLFVNPKLKQDAYGKLWAEIFVTKNLMGYIPSNCVK